MRGDLLTVAIASQGMPSRSRATIRLIESGKIER
jgi:hypothetical protein